MTIRRVDAGDPGALAAWHEVYVAAHRYGRPYAPVWQLSEMRELLAAPGRVKTVQLAWGSIGDQPICAGWMELPLVDNLDAAALEVTVVPDARRAGHGSAMFTALAERATAAGRRRWDAEVGFPYESAPDGTGTPGAAFARHHGFDFTLAEVQRVLDLPVPAGRLDRLVAEAGRHAAAYELRSFVGDVPEDLVTTFVALESTLETEAPVGTAVREPSSADVASFREREQVAVRQGRTKYTTVALDDRGVVVAYSDIAVPQAEPGRAYQWGTLVAPAHRGARLGLAVKAANLHLLQRDRDDLHTLVTFNAEINDHMIGINEQLGFRPVERLAQFQRLLP